MNAYILYTQHTNDRRKMAHKQFCRELVLALCQPQRDNTTQCHLSTCDHTPEHLRGQHFPETGSVRRDCRVCSNREPGGVRHLTTAFCNTCSENPHLCIGDCFRKYHTRATFREESITFKLYEMRTYHTGVTFRIFSPSAYPLTHPPQYVYISSYRPAVTC